MADMTTKFDRWLEGARPNAPSHTLDAAVHVRDTLEAAKLIAAETLPQLDASTVIEVYKMIERRAAYIEAKK